MMWERLDALDWPEDVTEGPTQSSVFMLELWRVRRECQLLKRTVHIQHSMGLLDLPLHHRVCALLHDLQWLLQVSPAASPALARQCVRIVQDRLFDEMQLMDIKAETRTATSAAHCA